MSETTLAVIDFSGLWWTFFHASGDELTSAAVTRTVDYVRRQAGRYTAVALCVDKPPYDRAKTFPAYKAHRPKKPPEALAMMRRAARDLLASGVHIFGADGQEADDLLATFVEWWRLPIRDDMPPEFDVVDLITADKDCWQLLRDTRVRMVSFSSDEVTTEATLMERHGIRPDQVPDFLALMGDKADGIPGVARVGAATATKLLKAHKNVTGVLNMLIDDPGWLGKKDALREALRVAAEPDEYGVVPLLMWRDLAQLNGAASIDCDRVHTKPRPRQLPADPPPPKPTQEPKQMPEIVNNADPLPAPTPTASINPDIMWSEPCDKLAAALAKAQSAIVAVRKTETADTGKYSYSYATLAAIQVACKPLQDNGIAVIQMPGSKSLQTVLMHTSGQWLRCMTPMQYGGGGPQAYGSAVTYARRYSLGAIAGVPIADDDDGAAAQARYGGKR